MKKYNTPLLYTLLGLCCLNSSCSKESSDDLNNFTDVNSWIYQVMKSNYLWQEEIGAKESYNMNSNTEDLFYGFISDNEKKTKDGVTYCYSYLEKKQSATKANDNPQDTYGMEYLFYRITSSTYYARIIYVLPETPAAKAGIKRGMWITTIDGKSITDSNRSQLAKGAGLEVGIYEGVYSINMQAERVVDIDAQVSVYENPLLKDTILETTNGQKIGYLAYTGFKTGPTGFQDKTYNNQMDEIFGGFRANDVSEFILDLRYNPGGYLDCAVFLSSLLVKSDAIGKVFCKVVYNENSLSKSAIYNFERKAHNLDLQRIYILAGPWTASASEAVINGLLPMMDVNILGVTTEGKNLGSVTYEVDKFDWILHPIVAKISNANGEGDYWNGIDPTPGYEYNEFQGKNPLGALGSNEDRMIALAIEKMGLTLKGKESSKSYSMADDQTDELRYAGSSLERKSESAVRIR